MGDRRARLLVDDGDRIHDRREEEPGLQQDVAEQVLHVAEVHIQHRQGERETGDEDSLYGYQDERGRYPGPNVVAEDHEDHQQHPHLDEKRDQHRGDERHDEVLSRKVDLADQTGVRVEHAHGAVERPAEEVPRQQATEQEGGEVLEAARIAGIRVCAEQDPEHDRIDHDGRQRVQERPRPPEDRTFVPSSQLTQGEVDDQFS